MRICLQIFTCLLHVGGSKIHEPPAVGAPEPRPTATEPARIVTALNAARLTLSFCVQQVSLTSRLLPLTLPLHHLLH